ncbi:MAG: tricarballylate utilization 4Fe-4S protein TcuB, partial [Pseudomonadota bacterium]
RQRGFATADITQLANLCVNCRGCYYACQYTAPHQFAINVPAALARVRRESWQEFAWPTPLAKGFHTRGVMLAVFAVIATACVLALATALRPDSGEGFYAVMSHTLMISVFLPAAFLPLLSLVIGTRRYWKTVGGKPTTWAHWRDAMAAIATLKGLSAGHGDGCNYEDDDRFSHARRVAHGLTAAGFLLCLGATTVATLMHYFLDWPAPYAWYTPPKVLGVPGGVLLCVGTAWLALLKRQADPTLGDEPAWGGDMAFVLLLFAVSFTGLALYALGDTALMSTLLVVHLGTVLVFFVSLPFSKMAHAFYRVAAHLREIQIQHGH